jgi:hypothetical protein
MAQIESTEIDIRVRLQVPGTWDPTEVVIPGHVERDDDGRVVDGEGPKTRADLLLDTLVADMQHTAPWAGDVTVEARIESLIQHTTDGEVRV